MVVTYISKLFVINNLSLILAHMRMHYHNKYDSLFATVLLINDNLNEIITNVFWLHYSVE